MTIKKPRKEYVKQYEKDKGNDPREPLVMVYNPVTGKSEPVAINKIKF